MTAGPPAMPGVAQQAPHAQELAPPVIGREVGAEGHDDARTEAVADAGDGGDGEETGEVARQGQEQQARRQRDQAGHGGPLAAPVVHDRPRRVEDRGVDKERDAGQEADLGDAQADVVAPEREEHLARLAQQAEGDERRARLQEDAAVVSHGLDEAAAEAVDGDVLGA